MQSRINTLGQPVGWALPGWRPPERPQRQRMEGRHAVLEPLDPASHAADLWSANGEDREGRMWTYLPYGPFESLEEYSRCMAEGWLGDDPLFYAIMEREQGSASGTIGFLRIQPESGSIEIGHVVFSPRLCRTAAATEASYLLLRHAFALGYRRCEWKCDALNAASRAAAERLGFSYEGTFRQATVYKGRNRDTAWYSMLDGEWPAMEGRFRQWLDPANFDDRGCQRHPLRALPVPGSG